jgi:hypothetical protein
MENRVKKNLTYEPSTYRFIEAFAKSNGNKSFSAANEDLIRIAITNLQAMELMNEKMIAALQSLELKIDHMEERFVKFENRTASLNVANIKLSGTVRQLLQRSLEEQSIFSATEIDMESKRGIKFAIEELGQNKKEEPKEVDPYEFHN